MRLAAVAALSAAWALTTSAAFALEDDGNTSGPSPISVAGARSVDVRNTSGGLTRYTSIPSGSVFRSHGGADVPCTFVSNAPGTTSDGQAFAAGQTVQSFKWLFVEGDPVAFGEPNPENPDASTGPLATAVRNFLVFCDSPQHAIDWIQVSARDPMLDPRPQLANLYNHLQLEQPVVFRNPVVDTWGGLITRYPSWLAIQATAWRAQRSNPAYWRGWTMYLLTTPSTLEFQIDFVPDPNRPSAAFHGVVACVAAGETPEADAISFPALPALPEQTPPGVNAPCMWTPPGPGSVTIEARITYRVTFWASGFTEPQPDYLWTSAPVTFVTGELSVVNTND